MSHDRLNSLFALTLCFSLVIASGAPAQAMATPKATSQRKGQAKSRDIELQRSLERFLLSTKAHPTLKSWAESYLEEDERKAWKAALGKSFDQSWPDIWLEGNKVFLFSDTASSVPAVFELVRDKTGFVRTSFQGSDITRYPRETFKDWLKRGFRIDAPKPSASFTFPSLIEEAQAAFFVPLVAAFVGGGIGGFAGGYYGRKQSSPGKFYSDVVSQGFSSSESMAIIQSLPGLTKEDLDNSLNELRQGLRNDLEQILGRLIREMPGYEDTLRERIMAALRKKIAKRVVDGFGLTCSVEGDGSGVGSFRASLDGRVISVKARNRPSTALEIEFSDGSKSSLPAIGSYLFSYHSEAYVAKSAPASSESRTDPLLALDPVQGRSALQGQIASLEDAIASRSKKLAEAEASRSKKLAEADTALQNKLRAIEAGEKPGSKVAAALIDAKARCGIWKDKVANSKIFSSFMAVVSESLTGGEIFLSTRIAESRFTEPLKASPAFLLKLSRCNSFLECDTMLQKVASSPPCALEPSIQDKEDCRDPTRAIFADGMAKLRDSKYRKKYPYQDEGWHGGWNQFYLSDPKTQLTDPLSLADKVTLLDGYARGQPGERTTCEKDMLALSESDLRALGGSEEIHEFIQASQDHSRLKQDHSRLKDETRQLHATDQGELTRMRENLAGLTNKANELYKLAELSASCCSDAICRSAVSTNTAIRGGSDPEPEQIKEEPAI